MFYFEDFFGKKVLKSSILKGLDHFFTTKDFILTTGERTELEELTTQNRNYLCEKLGIKTKDLITAKQTHSDNIQIVDSEINFYDNCDSLITNIENSALILNFADCVPIILFDSKNNIASVVHAGWRGTANEIVKKTVVKMIENFNSKPEFIKAAIGPSIGKCCFSTDKEVFDKLLKRGKDKTLYNFNEKENKYYIDLKLLNKMQLLDTGLVEIDVSDYCTSCISDIFFSYRKESGKTARHSAIIKLGKREEQCQ